MTPWTRTPLLICLLATGSVCAQSDEPNTWTRVCDGDGVRRASPGIVYLPSEKRFVLFGGSMGMLPKHKSPYSEMTLNLDKGRWENRFPKGKEGLWGELAGPSTAPRFPGSYYAVRMKDVQGNVRPYLGSGYDRAMYLYNTFAWDADRGKVVIAWHHGRITCEYDPVARTWEVVESAKDVPAGFWDDFLWGAMCYDPLNKEVLGGQGRWAYSTRNRTWRRLSFANKQLDPRRDTAERLRDRLKDLVGKCRSRYDHCRTAEEAAVALDAEFAAVMADTYALVLRFIVVRPTPDDRTRAALDAAMAEVRSAFAEVNAVKELLKRTVTAEAIHRTDDVRDRLDRCARALAVQPPARAFTAMAYDATHRKIVMFGGDRLDVRLADTWVYDCATRTWEQRWPKLAPPPRAGHGLTYLPKAGKILLVDGYGIGARGQCWVYDTGQNTWSLLKEGGRGKRTPLTPRPRYSFMPAPLAADETDRVVTIYRDERHPQMPKTQGTWTARIDTTLLDAKGTAELGVDPLATSKPTRSQNPRWYEANGGAPDPTVADKLKALPANTWVEIEPANRPKQNRAWGTTALDTARGQLIQWGGGHAAYCGNDMLHYSLLTNRCSIGSYIPEFQLNWNGSMLGPPIPTTYAGRPHSKHGYHHYAFDPTSRMLIVYGQHASRFFVYDPWTRDFKGAFGRELPKGSHNFICTPAPEGMFVWINSGLIVRLDPKTMTWRDLKITGVTLPRQRADAHGMAYDAKRNRLLCFSRYATGEVTAVDATTGAATRLTPAGRDRVGGYFPREAVYVAGEDVVMHGARQRLADGKGYWLAYDCARNAWIGLELAGKGISGVSLGLNYDPKRHLIWANDAYMRIRVLRLDLKTAAVRRLADEPAPAGRE